MRTHKHDNACVYASYCNKYIIFTIIILVIIKVNVTNKKML